MTTFYFPLNFNCFTFHIEICKLPRIDYGVEYTYKIGVETDGFSIWIANGSSPSTENNFYFPLHCSQVCCLICLYICAGGLPGMPFHISYLRNSSSFSRICHPAIWSFPWPPPHPLAAPNIITTNGCQGQGIRSPSQWEEGLTLALFKTVSI